MRLPAHTPPVESGGRAWLSVNRLQTTPGSHPKATRFHTIWTFGTLLGGVGVALIGLALDHVGEGIAIGCLAGAIAGLVVGIRLTSRLERDLRKPPTPPASGWRRWDDDD